MGDLSGQRAADWPPLVEQPGWAAGGATEAGARKATS